MRSLDERDSTVVGSGERNSACASANEPCGSILPFEPITMLGKASMSDRCSSYCDAANDVLLSLRQGFSFGLLMPLFCTEKCVDTEAATWRFDLCVLLGAVKSLRTVKGILLASIFFRSYLGYGSRCKYENVIMLFGE